MLRFLTLFLTAGILTISTVVQTGCVAVVAAGAGAGTVAYVRGQLNATLDAPLDPAVNATRQAISDLGFHKISDESDASGAVLVTRNAQDDRITIRLTREADPVTKVSIRVGMFGDEALSQTVLNAINQNL